MSSTKRTASKAIGTTFSLPRGHRRPPEANIPAREVEGVFLGATRLHSWRPPKVRLGLKSLTGGASAGILNEEGLEKSSYRKLLSKNYFAVCSPGRPVSAKDTTD